MRRAALRLSAVAAIALCAASAAEATTHGRAGRPAGSVVRIAFPSYDGTLTPYTFKLGYSLMTLVYDTLLWRDAQGVPRPWLARSLQRSRGGRRLTLRLREGVRWQDGPPLTSADVAFTLRFVSRRFHPRFTAELADIERVRTPDPLTVVIDLRRTSLGFADQPLADVPILPKHLWRDLPRAQIAPRGPPVGSGPYRLVQEGPGLGYRFRANRAYFRGRPRVERLDVPIIHDAQRTYKALLDRRVDMVPATLPDAVARRLSRSLGIAISRGPSYSGTALMLNVRRRPFVVPAARHAAAEAMDLEQISGSVAPAIGADRGYLHSASPWASSRALQSFDAGAAKLAFSRLRLHDVIEVLAPDNDAVRLEAGRQVALALGRVGVRARVVGSSPDALARATGQTGSPPTFTAAIVSIPALASYDPDLVGRLFGATAGQASLDTSGYHSAAFDALAERVATAATRPARRRAVQLLLERLARDAPAVPLFFSEGTFGYRRANYDGWVHVKGSGILDKRSFLPPLATPRPAPLARARGQSGAAPGGSLGVVSIVALIVLAGALGLGAVAVVRDRRSPRD